MSRHDASTSVNLGGKWSIALFALVLIGFVTETQLTQYVQVNLKYRQPYFIFYTVHSFFSIMFPVHFMCLTLTSKNSPRAIWRGLMFALTTHISPLSNGRPVSSFPTGKVLRLILLVTAGITLPGLFWFIAVSLAPLTDTTALWNSNAFIAYVVTVKLFKLDWVPLRLAAVIVATSGAMVVIYGSSTSPHNPEISTADSHDSTAPSALNFKPSTALIGDLLTLVAAIIYGIYQVLYKKYVALPTDPDADLDGLDTPASALYTPVPEDPDERTHVLPPLEQEDMVYPPPFALYPNLITSAIGVCTFLILWIPIPIIHVLGIKTFHLPPDLNTLSVIIGIALSGVVFNAGFMILLGIWGPILTSIGSLLTIVLVFISDIIFGGAVDTITVWSLLGCGSIIVAFGILAYDMMRAR